MNEDIKATFESVVSALAETGSRYAFIDALAAIEWSRSRATSDVDLVVSVDETTWPVLEAALKRRGLSPSGTFRPADTDIAVFWSSGSPRVRVDVFFAKVEFEEVVLSGAHAASVMGRDVRIAGPEAVIVYKLLANRAKDAIDLDQVFETQALANRALDWAFIDHWCQEWDVTDRLSPWRAKWAPRA